MKLTVFLPLLLWCPLPSELRKCYTFQPVILARVDNLQVMFLEHPLHVFQRSGLARVIGCESWTSEALAEDFVTSA